MDICSWQRPVLNWSFPSKKAPSGDHSEIWRPTFNFTENFQSVSVLPDPLETLNAKTFSM